MERTPNALSTIGLAISVLLLPTIGFIYSQGQSNQAAESLARSNSALIDSVKQLTSEIATLSMKLSTESVKIDYMEKRINKIESVVLINSNNIASIKEVDQDG